jgi:hypothetical protein
VQGQTWRAVRACRVQFRTSHRAVTAPRQQGEGEAPVQPSLLNQRLGVEMQFSGPGPRIRRAKKGVGWSTTPLTAPCLLPPCAPALGKGTQRMGILPCLPRLWDHRGRGRACGELGRLAVRARWGIWHCELGSGRGISGLGY